LQVSIKLRERLIRNFEIDAVAAAMYAIGFAETVRDLLKVRLNPIKFLLIQLNFS